jgi:hypothetical protein
VALLTHAAVGLAAKPVLPKTNVWLLIMASFAVDLAMPLNFLGLPSHNPFVSAALTIVAGLSVFLKTRKPSLCILCGALVFSHWIIDFITWPLSAWYANPMRMYLFPFGKSMEIGLGFYSTMTRALLCEAISFGAGLAVYLWYRIIRKQRNRKKNHYE